MLERALRFVDQLSLWSGRVASWLTLAVVLLLTVEVFRRYFLNSPTQWAHEVSTLMFGLMYVLTGAYAYQQRAHVGVDVLYARLSPRGRALIDVIGFFFLLLFAGALLVHGWRFFLASWQNREFSLALSYLPIYPFKLAIPLGALLLLLQGLAKFIRDLQVLFGGRHAD
jgi:TRAP-type mannitol/chloroaromatic compound transport system permease small subunit